MGRNITDNSQTLQDQDDGHLQIQYHRLDQEKKHMVHQIWLLTERTSLLLLLTCKNQVIGHEGGIL